MWLLDPASSEPYHGELPRQRVPLGFMAFLAACYFFQRRDDRQPTLCGDFHRSQHRPLIDDGEPCRRWITCRWHKPFCPRHQNRYLTPPLPA